MWDLCQYKLLGIKLLFVIKGTLLSLNYFILSFLMHLCELELYVQ